MQGRIFSRFFLRPGLLALVALGLAAAPAQAVQGGGAAVRGFKAVISRGMATEAALAEARLAALQMAARELGGQDEVRLFLSGEVMRAAPRPNPLALAWALEDNAQAQSSVSGVPPDMQVHVRLELAVGGGPGGKDRLAALLARPDFLDLYSRSLELLSQALKDYDAAAVYFLRPGPAARQDKDREERAQAALSRAYKALESALAYPRILPLLYPEKLAAPDDADGELLALVERLWRMSPDNYLLLAEFARLQLLHGRAPGARELLDQVLARREDFALALDLRGQCLLWLELPALALADFDRAIRLEPYHAAFFENRALARRILEDLPAMCRDLQEACRLGQCAGRDWAGAQGLCAR